MAVVKLNEEAQKRWAGFSDQVAVVITMITSETPSDTPSLNERSLYHHSEPLSNCGT